MKVMSNAMKWPTKTKVPALESRTTTMTEHTTDECIALHYDLIKFMERGLLVDLLTEKGRENWKLATRLKNSHNNNQSSH